MESLKKERKLQRAAFTRAHTTFTTKIDSDAPKEEKIIAFQLLESKMVELDSIQVSYLKALCESDATEESIANDVASDDGYKISFLSAKLKIDEFIKGKTVPKEDVLPASTSTNISAHSMTRSNFAKLNAPKFQGSVREWLPFWGQFKRVHEDRVISKEEKFQRLIDATIPGTRANDIVMSYPPTGENYEKAINSLKNRFGRDDLLVECYVRDLLGLVLQNTIKGTKKSSFTLSNLYDKLETYINALESLGVTTDKCAAMLYPLVESALPEEVLRVWQRSGMQKSNKDGEAKEGETKDGEAQDRLKLLIAFLRTEVEGEERIEMALTGFGVSAEPENSKRQQKGKITERTPDSTKNVASASVLIAATEKRFTCIFCNANHESNKCDDARKLPLDERKNVVKRAGACFKCLKRGHISKDCKVKVTCEWCSKKHAILMCSGFPIPGEKETNKRENETKKTVNTTLTESNLVTFSEFPTVCLQTLIVKLYSDLKVVIARAIIDTAAHRSYIRTDVAKKLGYVSRGEQEISHALFGGIKSKPEKYDIFLVRMKDLNDTYACNFLASNKNVICDSVSTVKHDVWVDDLRRNHNVVLSDIDTNENSIDVLIGADIAGKLMTGKKIELENGLCVFETLLGWTVLGKLPFVQSRQTDTALMVVNMFVREANLSDLWRLDAIGIMDPIEKLSRAEKDEKTREFLVKTAKMSESKRYVVKLPWVEGHSRIPTNYDMAVNRLNSTIKRLKAQNLYESYDKVFDEWLAEEIIERVPDIENDSPSHYLPHRPVVKDHGTTKIRPVFDASACKEGHPSLNHCLEKGPNLIELLPIILNRFRENAIGVISDIRKAFLQIIVDKDDRDYLRFLWLHEGEVITFRHCRVVFGLACSPFLLAAILELHLLSCLKIIDQKTVTEWTSETVKKLANSFYVDNCVTSLCNEEELGKFIRESNSVMNSGGFQLCGWEHKTDCTENDSAIVLGISWNKRQDTISLNSNVFDVDLPKVVTKRSILSFANKIFDPIGITTPVSLQPKLILQTLWEENCGRDTEIKEDKRTEFIRWASDLRVLKHLEISRYLGDGELTLHAFGDASGSAYAAAIFARVEGHSGVSVGLLSSKSRIAPKQNTISRLELMAATITARLATTVAQGLTRTIARIFYWSDSTTVIAWIKRDAQWNRFVKNRVDEIRRLSNRTDWRHIPGESNPADLPSRGCSPLRLVQSEWWLGPDWLYKPESEWPKSLSNTDEDEIQREHKKIGCCRND